MVKKIKLNTIIPMRHGNIVSNLNFLFKFFYNCFIIIISFFQ